MVVGLTVIGLIAVAAFGADVIAPYSPTAQNLRERLQPPSWLGGAPGHLLGTVDDQGRLDIAYHQVNTAGELRNGVCRSTPEVLPDGRLRLHEDWRWTSGETMPVFSQGPQLIETTRPGQRRSRSWASLFSTSLAAA